MEEGNCGITEERRRKDRKGKKEGMEKDRRRRKDKREKKKGEGRRFPPSY